MTCRILLHTTWLTLTCLLLAYLAMTRGALPIGAEQFWQVLLGEGASNVKLIVLEWRLPRVMIALLTRR